ncbi:MAG: SEL1-like repeat protein [Chloroflexi bacterium]|nr:SEL1-like repeat protein [Chloroflexota bacterium]
MTITISCTHPQVDYQLDLETSHNIAIRHNQGLGCPQDHRLAAYWFESAASRGYAMVGKKIASA